MPDNPDVLARRWINQWRRWRKAGDDADDANAEHALEESVLAVIGNELVSYGSAVYYAGRFDGKHEVIVVEPGPDGVLAVSRLEATEAAP